MNISVITVNYKNTKPTKELVNSIEKCNKNDNIKIIIADNDSSPQSQNELNKIKNSSFLDIDLFFFKENRFYWPAAKKIIFEKDKSIHNYSDWIIVCNNDILFNDKYFFANLEKFNGKKLNIIGPKILDQDNNNLNPLMIRRISNFELLFWNFYFKSYIFSKFLNKFLLLKKIIIKKNLYEDNTQVYAVHGSAIIFSNFFFQRGGHLDDKFELYCEELTTAEIARKIGLKTFYVPSLHLKHNEHSSTRRLKKKDIFNKAKKSHNYFVKKYLKK